MVARYQIPAFAGMTCMGVGRPWLWVSRGVGAWGMGVRAYGLRVNTQLLSCDNDGL